MLVLVLGSNFPVMFVGWEGVGLCSYLLIGSVSSRRPDAKKAFIVNRIGDFGFVLGVLLFVNFKSVDFRRQARAASTLSPELAFGTVWITCSFVGATGKSAQIPLYSADAMEGLTPVSALIHAATMVTAASGMTTQRRCSPCRRRSVSP